MVTTEVLGSVLGALFVAVVYLARSIARLAERVARLEGRAERDNGKR